MSQEQSITNSTVPGRRPIRVRFDKIRARQLSMIGGVELIGLGAAILLALLAAFLYFYLYLPANSRLKTAGLDRDRLQGQLRAARIGVDENTNVKETVNRITASMDDFEGNYLSAAERGRMSLYTELNDLIRENGLRNSAGPAYTTLEALGTRTQAQAAATAERQSSAKWQSVYPGIAVTVTVEGPYQNIRRFVRDVETSPQFLVINAVELEGLTQSAATQVPLAPDPRTLSRSGRPPAGGSSVRSPIGVTTIPKGAMVSLRLDLTTYFQRAAN